MHDATNRAIVCVYWIVMLGFTYTEFDWFDRCVCVCDYSICIGTSVYLMPSVKVLEHVKSAAGRHRCHYYLEWICASPHMLIWYDELYNVHWFANNHRHLNDVAVPQSLTVSSFNIFMFWSIRRNAQKLPEIAICDFLIAWRMRTCHRKNDI